MVRIFPLELETHFADGKVNAFLAVGKKVTLIDTGNPGKAAFQQLKANLHKLGFQLRDIDHIVLTHVHIDHAGGVPLIQKEADLPIYVHKNAEPAIYGGIQEFEKTELFFEDFLKQCGADPMNHIIKRRYHETNWENVSSLKHGDTIPIGGENFEVAYVPGHSQSDILLWNQDTGVAFVGDHLLKAFSVNAFIEPPLPGDKDRPKPLLQYRNSLEKMKKLPLKKLYPGHGESFTDHLSLIETRLREQEKRCTQILEFVSKGERTVFEIASEMYPRLKGTFIFLGLSQVQGHLDLLESRQQVSVNKRGTIWKYKQLS